jgi:serine/threonine protein kinase
MPPFDFVLAGRYRLIGPLGEGGMAAVYRGRDLRLNREVAIKILREDLTRDPGFLQRFEREAQFVASLSHPNIVPVYDVGEEEGSHFIVMEYVRGRTLLEVLEAAGALPPDRACSIMLQVLEALTCAHSQGLIHRDVKPANILLTSDGTARLADFGIAYLTDGSTTRTAAILGSAQYLSPEQSRGDEATERSDIYACGVVLYEMLTGAPPFDGPNALAIANQHLNDPPTPLHNTTAPVDALLEGTVMQALAKRPEDRFADTAAFAAALRGAGPSTALTAPQPLIDVDGLTGGQPLVPFEGSEESPEEERHREPKLEVRRSARKLYITGAAFAVVLGAAAYVAGRVPSGHSLPAYPSAAYALIPGLILLLLALAWMNTRSWLYTMDGNAAVVHWGLVGHHRFGVPVRFITTLELKQSLLERVLGIGTVEMTARDQHGEERKMVLEDLAHPRQVYEELMEHLGKTSRRI